MKQSPGIFLGYSGNGNLAIVEDKNLGKTKLSACVIFDKAHYTSDPENQPPMGKVKRYSCYVSNTNYIIV